VAGSAGFNVWNSCDSVIFHISVAEGTVQTGCFFMVNMIEQDRLIHRGPRKNRENRKEDSLRLDLKPVKSDYAQQENQDNSSSYEDPFFHSISMLFDEERICQEKIRRALGFIELMGLLSLLG
jgi:hypothetical protein